MKLTVDIYRSEQYEGMYLYLGKGTSLSQLPDQLRRKFGKSEYSMTLELTENRRLARANAKKVMREIDQQGYYLQLPPKPERYMQNIVNDKISGQPV